MPSKIQLDENLWFLYTCLQKSDMKTIDFAAVAETTNLKAPAARMRYTRLKRQIEDGTLTGSCGLSNPSQKPDHEPLRLPQVGVGRGNGRKRRPPIDDGENADDFRGSDIGRKKLRRDYEASDLKDGRDSGPDMGSGGELDEDYEEDERENLPLSKVRKFSRSSSQTPSLHLPRPSPYPQSILRDPSGALRTIPRPPFQTTTSPYGYYDPRYHSYHGMIPPPAYMNMRERQHYIPKQRRVYRSPYPPLNPQFSRSVTPKSPLRMGQGESLPIRTQAKDGERERGEDGKVESADACEKEGENKKEVESISKKPQSKETEQVEQKEVVKSVEARPKQALVFSPQPLSSAQFRFAKQHFGGHGTFGRPWAPGTWGVDVSRR